MLLSCCGCEGGFFAIVFWWGGVLNDFIASCVFNDSFSLLVSMKSLSTKGWVSLFILSHVSGIFESCLFQVVGIDILLFADKMNMKDGWELSEHVDASELGVPVGGLSCCGVSGVGFEGFELIENNGELIYLSVLSGFGFFLGFCLGCCEGGLILMVRVFASIEFLYCPCVIIAVHAHPSGAFAEVFVCTISMSTL